MRDIVDWLRVVSDSYGMGRCEEALEEIERLREALNSITKVPRSEAAYAIIQVFAHDALLKGSNDDSEWR